jgi:hypothetical protein
MLYGFLNCFWGYALKVEAVGRPPSFRRRGTMAPLVPDVARGNRGGVGSGSTELAEVLALHRGEPLPVWTERWPSRFYEKETQTW